MIRSRQRLVRQSSHPLLRVVVPLAVLGALLLGAAPALGHEFTPRLVISDAQMRDYDSMSAAQVQAFLNTKSGPLKRMSFARHDGGPTAPASVIIWEAAQAWHINPKVLLTMLQKEQSLLTRRTLARNTLSRAMGAGCPDSGGNRYPGFGNQIWHSARLLDGYGEVGKTTPYVPAPWYYGMANKYTRSMPTSNAATYKLYVYNPSIGARKPYGHLSTQSCSGNANFWKIYWKYFGNTFAPVAVTPVPSGCDTTTVVLSRPFSRVMYGQQAAISGCLSATPTANLDGAKVRLESLSGSVWTAVPGAEQTVGPGGAFSFPLPSQQISRVRVVFPGTATLAPSVSGCFVSDIVALVSAPARWGSYRAGSVMGLRGSILPAHRSVVRVSIQRRVRGRYRAFRTLTAKTNWWGGWSLGVRLPKGAYRYQVSHNDATHGLGGSTWGSVYIR